MGRRKRTLTVKDKYFLTPHMIRTVLTGDDLYDFPENQETGYIKLLFASGNLKPTTRTYTIRAFDKESLLLTVDFVSHGETGPASAWAANTMIGDVIDIDGPGDKKLITSMGDWFFLVGDMTALPAIAANLERLPVNAQGYAVIEVLSEEDRQVLPAPKGINVHWLINSAPAQPNTILLDSVRSLTWFSGCPDVWVASEFTTMRNLRRYFKERIAEKGMVLARGQLYASSYWKMGETDEGNKAAKKLDTEA